MTCKQCFVKLEDQNKEYLSRINFLESELKSTKQELKDMTDKMERKTESLISKLLENQGNKTYNNSNNTMNISNHIGHESPDFSVEHVKNNIANLSLDYMKNESNLADYFLDFIWRNKDDLLQLASTSKKDKDLKYIENGKLITDKNGLLLLEKINSEEMRLLLKSRFEEMMKDWDDKKKKRFMKQCEIDYTKSPITSFKFIESVLSRSYIPKDSISNLREKHDKPLNISSLEDDGKIIKRELKKDKIEAMDGKRRSKKMNAKYEILEKKFLQDLEDGEEDETLTTNGRIEANKKKREIKNKDMLGKGQEKKMGWKMVIIADKVGEEEIEKMINFNDYKEILDEQIQSYKEYSRFTFNKVDLEKDIDKTSKSILIAENKTKKLEIKLIALG